MDTGSWRFDHVHIICSDIIAMEKWFVNVIGAQLVRRYDGLAVPSTVLNLGGARILLRPPRPGEPFEAAGARRHGIDHFGILVQDLKVTADELRQRGAFFEIEPFELIPGLRMSYVLGPDNVRIDFIERDDESHE